MDRYKKISNAYEKMWFKAKAEVKDNGKVSEGTAQKLMVLEDELFIIERSKHGKCE